jgi:1-phosphatidylinositol-3-phosphate 5-kinase
VSFIRKILAFVLVASLMLRLLKILPPCLGSEFSDGGAKFYCKVFFAEQFDALRRNCECEKAYIQSLARCIKWDASGGKSGSLFLKTKGRKGFIFFFFFLLNFEWYADSLLVAKKDDRFIMKQISKPEVDAFIKFAPSYFEYMSQAFFHEVSSGSFFLPSSPLECVSTQVPSGLP